MKDKTRTLTLPALFDKESSTATEFRRLVSNIKSRVKNGEFHSVLVTSSMIGEGKSLTSSLLAITLADLTKAKVGLVDFDLRRPKLNIYFDTILENGVSDVLMGRVGIKDIMRKTTVPNLSVISAGKLENNPSDILDKSDLASFIQELRFYFDYVVIDSPPVIPVSDPLLLSSHVDGVLMVIRAGTTQREVIHRAVNLMKNAGVNLLGAVLNDFEDVLPYYYKDKYYGYRYYHLENSKK